MFESLQRNGENISIGRKIVCGTIGSLFESGFSPVVIGVLGLLLKVIASITSYYFFYYFVLLLAEAIASGF